MPSEIIVEFPSPLTDREKKMIYGYKGEVVRCKDCKLAERKCKWYCVKRQNIVNDDDFCSWGERKEDV